MTRGRLITVVVLFLLLGWFVWSLYATARQAGLNAQIISAVDKEDASAIKRLLDDGADPNTHKGGIRPPSWTERLKSFFGLLPNQSYSQGIPILECVAGEDRDVDVEIVKMLVAKGVDVNARDDDGYTAIIMAAMFGRIETVQTLLKAGARVDAHGEQGFTALQWAIWMQKEPLVRLLILNRADVNRPAVDGRPILVVQIQQNGTQWKGFLQWLIAHGASINQRAPDGQSALTAAAEICDPAAVRLLLARGADVNVRDNKGRSVLWYARFGDTWEHLPGRNQVVAMLTNAGAKE